MISLSGALLAVAALLLIVGVFDGSGLLYASIAVTLVAAALLPLGVARATAGSRSPGTAAGAEDPSRSR